MTKKDFAAFTGVMCQTIYRYEREKTVPGADMLFRIAAKTGCSVDWLIGLKEEEKDAKCIRADGSHRCGAEDGGLQRKNENGLRV